MTIVIPSMGRCGSTSLYFAIRACVPPHAGRFVARLFETEILDGEIIKTHDIAPDLLPEDWKVIYLYGDTDAIAKSVLKQSEEWKKQHFYHLGQTYIDDNIDWSFLNDNMNSWKKHDNVLFIHYDELFESSKIISAYLGIEIYMPPRIKRTTE